MIMMGKSIRQIWVNCFFCAFYFRLMECAKDMIRESLPIKCLEAVILGLYPQSMLKLQNIGFTLIMKMIMVLKDVRDLIQCAIIKI